MPSRNKKANAPAVVEFSTYTGVKKGSKPKPCVYATCQFTGKRVGPIWTHSMAAVKRAMATLTRQCPCPARRHQAREFMGKPIES
jgi:hypothetical protein